MVHENEIVMLLIGLGGLFFLVTHREKLVTIRQWKLLFAAFALLLTGWGQTVLEGFAWPDVLNLSEHLCYAASSLTLAVWFWKVFGRDGAGDE